MRKRKTGLNLLVLGEIFVLIVVVVLGVLACTVGIPEKLTGKDSVTKQAAEQEDLQKETEDNEDENAISIIPEESTEERITFSEEVEAKLSQMTLEEKVAQMFITSPEELTGADPVTVAGEGTKSAIDTYPVGGLIYASKNFVGPEQTLNLLQGTQGYSQEKTGLNLFLIIEEQGGETASPLASVNAYQMIASPADLGAQGNPDEVAAAANARAAYLNAETFNTVLAPVADVADGSSEEHDRLTYSSDITVVADCVRADIEGTQSAGIMSVMKGFPGLVNAASDYSAYQAGIDAGVKCIMVSNVPSLELTGNGSTPCSLSAGTTQKLRDEMGFDGLLMTDNLAAESVSALYGVEDAAVNAVKAGMNLIYVPSGFQAAYQAVVDAVSDETISITNIDNSVGRILTEKLAM